MPTIKYFKLDLFNSSIVIYFHPYKCLILITILINLSPETFNVLDHKYVKDNYKCFSEKLSLCLDVRFWVVHSFHESDGFVGARAKCLSSAQTIFPSCRGLVSWSWNVENQIKSFHLQNFSTFNNKILQECWVSKKAVKLQKEESFSCKIPRR